MWWYRALHRRLLDALAGVHGTVLDAGCGTGGLLARLRVARPRSATGRLEWAETACRRAAAKSGAHWCAARVNALPFADGCFDAAIAADVLCHRAVEPRARAGRTAAACCAPADGSCQHAGLHVAAVGARSAGAQRPPSHRGPARGHAARRPGFVGVRVGYWNGLLLPLMVVQRKLSVRGDRRLGCRRVSAMAGCHAACHDRNRASPAVPPACRRLGAGDRGATMNDAIDLLAPLSVALCRSGAGADRRRRPVDRRSRSTAARPPSAAWSRRCRSCAPAGGLEIVLVNDGSPDNSDEVCQRAGAQRDRCRSPMSSTRATSASTTRS